MSAVAIRMAGCQTRLGVVRTSVPSGRRTRASSETARLGVGRVLDHLGAEDAVEACVVEGELRHAADDPPGVALPRHLRQQALADVDRSNPRTTLDGDLAEQPGAATRIEQVATAEVVSGERHLVDQAQPLRHLVAVHPRIELVGEPLVEQQAVLRGGLRRHGRTAAGALASSRCRPASTHATAAGYPTAMTIIGASGPLRQ